MRILIVDDHQLFIDGLRHILNKLEPSAAITTSATAEGAVEMLESDQEFDLILLDLSMPGLGGMAVLQRMHERGAWLPLVVVSAEEDLREIRAVLDLGALGFIPKTASGRQMLEALGSVLDGNIYVPPEIERQLDRQAERHVNPGHSGITRRQHQVLELLARGYSNQQIATTLFLTEHTVKSHLSALYAALRVTNRTECVRVAQRRGMLEPG